MSATNGAGEVRADTTITVGATDEASPSTDPSIPSTHATTSTSQTSTTTNADGAATEDGLVDPVCRRVDVDLLEETLRVAPIELAEDADMEARGVGGVICPFEVDGQPGALTIELWPSIPDDQMIALLQSLPFASEGSIDVFEQDGLWVVATGDRGLAVVKKRGDRWWSIALTLRPEDELPDPSSLQRALDLAAKQIT